MSISIDNAFVKQFEREVFEAYQRMGSKLRETVRSKSNVKGSSAVFQKIGTGTASTKSAHGMVPVMNLGHTAIDEEDLPLVVQRVDRQRPEAQLGQDRRAIGQDAQQPVVGRHNDLLGLRIKALLFRRDNYNSKSHSFAPVRGENVSPAAR